MGVLQAHHQSSTSVLLQSVVYCSTQQPYEELQPTAKFIDPKRMKGVLVNYEAAEL